MDALQPIPLHYHALEPTLLLVVGLAGAGSAVLLGLGVAAFSRRRSRSYLLVVLALAALLARTAVAGLTMADLLTEGQHHLLEHTLDVAMAALVIGAVYYARSVTRTIDEDYR